MASFVDLQAAHIARTRDLLVTDWLYNGLRCLELLVPPSPTGSEADTLPVRLSRGQATEADLHILPFFRRVSLLMAEQLTAVMERTSRKYVEFWAQYDARQCPAEGLLGYPDGVKVRVLQSACGLHSVFSGRACCVYHTPGACVS